MPFVVAFISLLVPGLTGFALVRACIPGERYLCRHDLLKLCLGIGVGFGICSCMFFVWLLTYGTVHALYIAVEIGAAILASALAVYRATGCGLCRLPPLPESTLTRWRYLVLIVAGLTFVSACVSFALESRIHPEGQGDAWAIWNLRARYLFRGGDHWRNAFSGNLSWSHLDYPLLLPGLVARSWIYTGTETQSVPIGIAMLFTCAAVGVLITALCALGGREKALLAGTVLVGTASFVKLGAAQYADVPVAFYFLSSIVLICMRDRLPPAGTILAGVTAALAAWTKNEGLLFVALVPIAMAWAKQPVRKFMMGAIAILALLAIFKLGLAPPDYLAQNDRAGLLRKLADPTRYLLIAAGFLYELSHFGGQGLNPLLPFVATPFLLRFSDRCGARMAAIVLLGMCVGFVGVYLITPVDLAWHIAWSLDRLLLQLWPATVFLCFYTADVSATPSWK